MLEDIQPPRDKVFDDLPKELREGLVCPVLLGSATRTNGVLRLMKALRHESPGIADTAKRLGLKAGNEAVGYVLKTSIPPTAAKCRLLACSMDRSAMAPPSSLRSAMPAAWPGCSSCSDMPARSEGPHRPARPSRSASSTTLRPATLTAGKQAHPPLAKVVPHAPVLAIAVAAKERKDDVKLGQAAGRLLEEDPSISVVHNAEAHEIVLWGQGEMQLRVATERLADRFGVATTSHKPTVGYRETIKKSIVQRGRHKKQSGGHGQYGDVVLDIKPLPRGAGFTFTEEIKEAWCPATTSRRWRRA